MNLFKKEGAIVSYPFHFMLARVYHMQTNALRPKMGEVGLSPGQPKILFYLTEHNNCMQKDLAENCDVEPATISRMITNMEESGLIRRNIQKENRRAVTISITEKGQEAYRHWQDIFADVEQKELKGFTPQEQANFKDYLNRIYQNFTGKNFID